MIYYNICNNNISKHENTKNINKLYNIQYIYVPQNPKEIRNPHEISIKPN